MAAIAVTANLFPTSNAGASAVMQLAVTSALSAGAGGGAGDTESWAADAALTSDATLDGQLGWNVNAHLSSGSTFDASPTVSWALTADCAPDAKMIAYAGHLPQVSAALSGDASVSATLTVRTPFGIDIVPVGRELRNGQHVVTAFPPMGLWLGAVLSDPLQRKWRLDAIEPALVPGQVKLFLVPLDGNLGVFPLRLSLSRPS